MATVKEQEEQLSKMQTQMDRLEKALTTQIDVNERMQKEIDEGKGVPAYKVTPLGEQTRTLKYIKDTQTVEEEVTEETFLIEFPKGHSNQVSLKELKRLNYDQPAPLVHLEIDDEA